MNKSITQASSRDSSTRKVGHYGKETSLCLRIVYFHVYVYIQKHVHIHTCIHTCLPLLCVPFMNLSSVFNLNVLDSGLSTPSPSA